MRGEPDFDWYGVSKLEAEQLDIQKFKTIVSKNRVANSIGHVSTSYRKKLLLLFQNSSHAIKNKIGEMQREQHKLTLTKNSLANRLAKIEEQTEISYKEVNNLKVLISEKKKVAQKFKEKIIKNKKKQPLVYFCPFCNRTDFPSREIFSFHMINEHKPNKTAENLSETTNQMINSQLKDFIMTLKDKEMELMSMILKEKKEMHTQELEKKYQFQLKKYMKTSGPFNENQTHDESDEEELKGQSKFLFYQKSEQMKNEINRENNFKNKIKQSKSLDKSSREKYNYQPGNYYEVFKNVEENVSENVESSAQIRILTEQSQRKLNFQDSRSKNYGHYDSNEFLSKFLKNYTMQKDNSSSFVQSQIPKPLVDQNHTRFQKQSVYIMPSISDRLRLERADDKYETIYSTKKKFYENEVYIFNCGQLIDDNSGDSDYEDYFGPHSTKRAQIEDQQIKYHKINNKNEAKTSKLVNKRQHQSINLSKLLSPQSNQSLNDKSDKFQKQKSSVIIDLSDSFSKRDFEISKDQESINLSDLKLSKLQRKREQEKQNKLKDQQKIQKKDQQEESQQEKQIKPFLFIKSKIPNFQSQQMDFLKQFQRKKIVPMVYNNTKTYTVEYNPNQPRAYELQRVNIIGEADNITTRQNNYSSTQPGILNEFFKQDIRIQKRHNIKPEFQDFYSS